MLKLGSFDPDTLTLLYQAFDETWQQIARNYQTQAMIEDRRDRLASIIVGLADDGVRDLAQIKEVAMLLMMHPDEPTQLNGNQASVMDQGTDCAGRARLLSNG